MLGAASRVAVCHLLPWYRRGHMATEADSVGEAWRVLYEAFDPERPAEDPKRRADRPRSPAGEIINALKVPFADSRFLLSGTIGTGKTTELFRIKEARQGDDVVVFVDLVQHFSTVMHDEESLQTVSAWEICFLAGVALIAECRHRHCYEFPGEHLQALSQAWERLARSTETPSPEGFEAGDFIAKAVDAFAVGMGLGPVTTMGAAVVSAASGWRVPLGQAKRTPLDQEEEVQTLLEAVNTLVRLAKHQLRRVLFVIDGLDRIRTLERATRLLVESQMLGQLDCPLVICAPLALRHDIATAAVRRFVPKVLANEPVRDQSSPTREGAGVEFFCEVFQKRVNGTRGAGLVAEPELRRLAFYSGGRARDFIGSVRDLALLGYQQGLAQATAETVTRVIEDRRRQREHGLHRGHIELLEAVARDPEHRLPKELIVQELLITGALLPYPDGSEWYYPHPLLTVNLVKAG